MKEKNRLRPPPESGEKPREGQWRLTLDEKVVLRLVKIAEYLKREQSAVFKKYGITFPQYNVLRVLEFSENGQQKLSNLSRILLVAVSNLSGLVRRLEKEGLIARKRDPNDERVTHVVITQKGREIIRRCDDEKNRDLERILSTMSDEDKRFIVLRIKEALSNPEGKSQARRRRREE